MFYFTDFSSTKGFQFSANQLLVFLLQHEERHECRIFLAEGVLQDLGEGGHPEHPGDVPEALLVEIFPSSVVEGSARSITLFRLSKAFL